MRRSLLIVCTTSTVLSYRTMHRGSRSSENTIKDLKAKVKKAEVAAKRSVPIQEHYAKMKQLEESKTSTQEAITNFHSEQKDIRKWLDNLVIASAELEDRSKTVDRQKEEDLPDSQNSLSLYHNISGINWNYLSENVRGYITMPKQGDVYPFNIDPTISRFEVVNYLWDLIETTTAQDKEL